MAKDVKNFVKRCSTYELVTIHALPIGL